MSNSASPPKEREARESPLFPANEQSKTYHLLPNGTNGTTPLVTMVQPNAARVTKTQELERIAIGAVLRHGCQVVEGIDLRPEDFFTPIHAEVFRWLNESNDQWIPANLTFNQAALAEAGFAEKMGDANGIAFELDQKVFDVAPSGLAHLIRNLVFDALERKARQAAVGFSAGNLTKQEYRAIQAELDERTTELEGNQSPPAAVPLVDFLHQQPDPKDTLLGSRFLCRGGGMLFIGPSGIGKSSASVQMDILWSIGREAFGIRVPRPLRILQIQAENDEGDIHEMVHGVIAPLGLTDAELEICRQNLTTITEKARTAERFISEVLTPALHHYRPDIVRIDPLLAYLGADPTDTAKLSQFCRNLLNPLLDTYDCGCVLNHHTPKTTNRDTSNWRASDWMYSGAGGAELTNWARAILVVEPTSNPAAFRFIAAKRGRRIDWCDDEGEATFQRVFCHSEGSISWREATPEEAAGIRAKGESKTATDEELIAHVPITGTVPKDVLLAKWNSTGLGEKKCRSRLNVFLSDDPPRFYEHQEKRSGTRPRVLISRHEQTLL